MYVRRGEAKKGACGWSVGRARRAAPAWSAASCLSAQRQRESKERGGARRGMMDGGESGREGERAAIATCERGVAQREERQGKERERERGREAETALMLVTRQQRPSPTGSSLGYVWVNAHRNALSFLCPFFLSSSLLRLPRVNVIAITLKVFRCKRPRAIARAPKKSPLKRPCKGTLAARREP